MKSAIVMIDNSNILAWLNRKNVKIDIKEMRRYILEKLQREIVHAECFMAISTCPGSRQHSFKKILLENGIKIHTKSPTAEFENGNQKLVCDLDDEIKDKIKSIKKDFNTLILFSGDGDFIDIVQELQSSGKDVIIIAPRCNASEKLIDACNHYVDLEGILPEIILLED